VLIALASAITTGAKATMIYTSRADFDAATTVTFSDDYSSYGWSDSTNYGSAVTLGPVTYTNTSYLFGLHGPAWGFGFGSSYWHGVNVLSFPSATLTFSLPTTAIGFDFGQYWGTNQPFSITINGVYTVLSYPNDNAFKFFGVVNDDLISSVTINAEPTAVMTNLEIGTARSQPSSVPDEGTLLPYLFVSLVGIGFARWAGSPSGPGRNRSGARAQTPE
jgi:hypothetical protein